VTATAERPKVSASSFAAFATAPICNAINLSGHVSTSSYDSSVGPPGAVNCNANAPPPSAANSSSCSDGDVGTNGNLNVSGSVDLHGNLYTPREGVGVCTAGAVTGLTGTCDPSDPACQGSAVDGMVKLPKAVVYPVPPFTASVPTNPVSISDPSGTLPSTICTNSPALGGLGLTPATCSVSGTTLTLTGPADINLPSVTVPNGYTLVINGANSPGQKININSLDVSGALNFNYASNGQSVIMQFAGIDPVTGVDMTTAPFNLSDLASWKQNKPSGANYDASALQIVYGGSAAINMKGGNSQSAATIYAPNAAFSLQGTQDFFGSVLAKTVQSNGTPTIRYDRRLQHMFWVAGQPMMGTFSWRRGQ
jgi:hypothetical protein